MTATRPQHYDQCDDTCTVDCGHCKGKGRPDPLTALRDRLAAHEAVVRYNQERAYLNHDTLLEAEYMGERRGLRLALGYINEALRMTQPAEEAAR